MAALPHLGRIGFERGDVEFVVVAATADVVSSISPSRNPLPGSSDRSKSLKGRDPKNAARVQVWVLVTSR